MSAGKNDNQEMLLAYYDYYTCSMWNFASYFVAQTLCVALVL